MREELSRVEVLGNPEYPPRKAIEDISRGMALVIDARGILGASVIGYILVVWLQERGVVAAVSDGSCGTPSKLRPGACRYSAPAARRRPA
jgi:regulator of RNase E activity RraA